MCDSTFDSYSLHGVNGEDWGQGETPVFSTQVLSRTVGGRFRYRISLLYRKSLFFTPNASENASRTPGGLFEHGTHIPYRRSLFLVRCASENASHLVVRSTGKRVAVASERPVQPRTGQVEGVGANKVSGVLSEASCCRCETSNFTKKEADLFSLFLFLTSFTKWIRPQGQESRK